MRFILHGDSEVIGFIVVEFCRIIIVYDTGLRSQLCCSINSRICVHVKKVGKC